MTTLPFLRPELLSVTDAQWATLLPYDVLFVGTLLLLIMSVIKGLNNKWLLLVTSLGFLGYSASASWDLIKQPTLLLFNGMMVSDRFTHSLNFIFLVSAMGTVIAAFRYLDKEDLQYPEFNILVLFATLGMMFMASAVDLITIFIGLELMSLSVYVLVGFRRADRRSNEAAMKYFVLGAVASAVFLYGTSLLYGATGTTLLRGVLAATHADPLFVVGAAFVTLGFLFKIAAVPFHMWMPDVYEGAPTPVTGFMTTGLKVAAFGTFIRIFQTYGLVDLRGNAMHDILWACAVATMFAGNVIALTQTNLKRMLAYSSIAHTGYLLVGFLGSKNGGSGFSPVLVYLASYAVMNLGAFGILSALSQRGDKGLNLPDLAGLSRRHPGAAFAMAVFLLSMAGIPPTAGFAAKYLIFYSAVQAGEIWLVVLGVLCSAISVFYYLRVLVYMYMRDPDGEMVPVRLSWGTALTAMALIVLTLQIGLMPARFVLSATRAIASL